MEFEAFKMDGLGNDFVIIDQRINSLNLSNDQILKICDRDFIGCDQLIYINKSQKADADVVFLTRMEAAQMHVEMELDVLLIY